MWDALRSVFTSTSTTILRQLRMSLIHTRWSHKSKAEPEKDVNNIRDLKAKAADSGFLVHFIQFLGYYEV